MKKLLAILVIFLAVSVDFAQETGEKKKPTEADKVANFDKNGLIKRGAPIGKARTASLAKILSNPQDYVGETILVEGLIVRSCKKEGCWAELAVSYNEATALAKSNLKSASDSKQVAETKVKSIRVKMKDHAFFIPLESEGLLARVQGRVLIKTLSAEQVKHMIEEDGAKFAEINPDGTVTEVTFEADGIELRKPISKKVSRRR